MCGIFAICHYPSNIDLQLRSKALSLSKLIRHRGPDWNGCLISKNNIFCHERLAIVGVESGSQPLTNADETVILAINGEIYNHIDLRKCLKGEIQLKSGSDCEILVPLYEQLDVEFIPKLNGMFSFVLYDRNKDRHIVARDPIGITSLYWGSNKHYPGSRFYSSEMKSLQEICDEIHTFPPGHMYDSSVGQIVQYFNPDWFDVKHIPNLDPNLDALRESLELAVRRRLMSEVPFGVLLSGGLDSSLIASITVREVKKTFINQFIYGGNVNQSGFGINMAWPQVHSFSIGLPGSPDLKAAKEVADFIGTKHHGFTFTLQEAHDALSDVIYHLETYDVTTIRASTPMYLLSRKIKAMGVKMVLSGEGSDEIFAGYLYFHAAPNPEELHLETLDRVKNLHTADCLRANKSTMAWGLEARVPFLDVDFLQIVMNLKAEEKMFKIGGEKMEKYLIRKAFDTVENPYLPKNILWRQKEQFSDGVGYSWIDSLKNAAEKNVSDEDFAKRFEKWSYDTPDSKEGYWYREMFDILFTNPNSQFTVKRWTPRVDWGCSSDPSGRAQKIHCDPKLNIQS